MSIKYIERRALIENRDPCGGTFRLHSTWLQTVSILHPADMVSIMSISLILQLQFNGVIARDVLHRNWPLLACVDHMCLFS